MSSVKKILVVDDYFEMLSFLRSMLELSNKAYQVTGVPSAEEGMLELRQTKYHLLITDLRLPGISGFDLIRRVRRMRPDVPVIMITGYSSEQGEQEAAQLGVFRYFRKPLDTDTLLAAVSEALYGHPTQIAKSESVDLPKTDQVSSDVTSRLLVLRTDTGAVQVVLMGMDGRVVYDTGGGVRLDVPALAPTIIESMKASFVLARQLGSDTPFTIQYQEGQVADMYSANVGENYLLSIFFDAHGRRGRIGTVWVFAQRAIKDIQPMLVVPALSAPPTPINPPIKPLPEQPVTPLPKETTQLPTPLPEPKPKRPGAKPVEPVPPPAPPNPRDAELDAFWAAAVQSESHTRKDSHLVSFEEAQVQGLLPEEVAPPSLTTSLQPDVKEPSAVTQVAPDPSPEKKEAHVPAEAPAPTSAPPEPNPTVDLDRFWDQALEQNTEERQKSLTWEQALQRGLIPREMRQDRSP